MSPVLTLAAGEVHLWFAQIAKLAPSSLAAAQAMLSVEEQRQLSRFKRERDQHTFLVSRALRRHALSRYAAVAPPAWQFTKNAHGRPQIAGPPHGISLDFNISKSAGVVVCAITGGEVVGVDIECLDRPVSDLLFEAVLADGERASLQAWDQVEQRRRFYAFWTLKEAYLKARGEGLSQPLNTVVFEVGGEAELQARLLAAPVADGISWQFSLLQPLASHRVAVCRSQPLIGCGSIAMRWLTSF